MKSWAKNKRTEYQVPEKKLKLKSWVFFYFRCYSDHSLDSGFGFQIHFFDFLQKRIQENSVVKGKIPIGTMNLHKKFKKFKFS
jgi:hypothetical protein